MKIKLNFNLHAHLSLFFFAMIAKDKQKMNYGFIKEFLPFGFMYYNNITFDNNNI